VTLHIQWHWIKLIKLIVGYPIVPASFYNDIQLVVEFISILISEGAQFASATLQAFAEGDQAPPQNPSLCIKFIFELLSEGAGFVPTTFRAFELVVTLTSIVDVHLVVELNLIPPE